jgi:hypothetical protein
VHLISTLLLVAAAARAARAARAAVLLVLARAACSNKLSVDPFFCTSLLGSASDLIAVEKEWVVGLFLFVVFGMWPVVYALMRCTGYQLPRRHHDWDDAEVNPAVSIYIHSPVAPYTAPLFHSLFHAHFLSFVHLITFCPIAIGVSPFPSRTTQVKYTELTTVEDWEGEGDDEDFEGEDDTLEENEQRNRRAARGGVVRRSSNRTTLTPSSPTRKKGSA